MQLLDFYFGLFLANNVRILCIFDLFWTIYAIVEENSNLDCLILNIYFHCLLCNLVATQSYSARLSKTRGIIPLGTKYLPLFLFCHMLEGIT